MDQHLKAFCSRKLGMFIHWGLYAVPGGRHNGQVMNHIGEWFQSYFRMPNEEYAKFAEQFKAENFSADEWIRRAAQAGFKYIVFTTKHHDGFSMYDTKVSDYNVVKMTPFGRDPLKELQTACKKYGLKLGIYYSHDLDWHEKDGGDPGPGTPLNCGVAPVSNTWDFPDYESKNFAVYFYGKVIPQITELMTNYGEICELWCDYPASIKPQYSRELREVVKMLQPGCLINERIGNGYHDFAGLGDNELLFGKSGIPAESPGTLNDTWGFKYDDHNWKSTEQIISQFISLVEKNANYLLNVGPTPEGELTPETKKIFDGMAKWINGKEDAVFGAEPSPYSGELDYAYCTVSGNSLNLFLKKDVRKIELNGVKSKVCACSGNAEFEQDGTKLRLLIPENFYNSFLPLLRITFNEPPQITDELSSGNILGMSQANIIVPGEPPDRCWPFLFGNGVIGNWIYTQDTLEWGNVKFPAAGKYRVFITTLIEKHGSANPPWDGNRLMAVAWNDQELLTGILKPDTDLSNSYREMYESDLGTVTVREPLHGKITLKTLAIYSESAKKIKFVSIRFLNEDEQ